MVRAEQLKECFKSLIGWKQHYNSDAEINEELQESQSGEYYQDFHPALSLNIIKQSLERGRDLNEYLTTKTQTAITQLLNDVGMKRQADGVKDLLLSETLLNKFGWANDRILPEGRFVGFMFELVNSFGLNLTLQSIGMQISQAQELKIYVYHSSQIEPIVIKTLNVTKPIAWNWLAEAIQLYRNDEQVQAGTYYVGYYQEDLTGQAINYTNFDWNKGYCGTCDGGVMRRVWNSIRNYVYFRPIYVPAASLSIDRFMFDSRAVQIDNTKSWGMNFKIGVGCDLTNFYCDNRMQLKNALGLKVSYLILQDIKFSQEFNSINEDIKALIINDLEGDKDTYNFGIASKLKQELKNVVMNTTGLGKDCLPCNDNTGIEYGQA
jgi:hypothetical protein